MDGLRRVAPLVAVVVTLAAGCSGADEDVPSPSAPPVVAGCSAEEHPPLQAGSHLLGDTDPPVPYSSVPPTSGWHASGVPAAGVHDEPLTDPEIVALLEVGQVVAVYDPGQLDEEAAAELEELAVTGHEGRLSVTPANTDLPSPVALAAWGVLQRCEVVSAEAVTGFVLDHYGRTDAEH